MKRYWLLLVLLGCSSSPDPVVPPPYAPTDTELCASMCIHLQELGCEEGDAVYNNDIPGPDGLPNQSCESHCEELQTKGFFVNPRCVMVAPKCADIEAWRKKDAALCGALDTP